MWTKQTITQGDRTHSHNTDFKKIIIPQIWRNSAGGEKSVHSFPTLSKPTSLFASFHFSPRGSGEDGTETEVESESAVTPIITATSCSYLPVILHLDIMQTPIHPHLFSLSTRQINSQVIEKHYSARVHFSLPLSAKVSLAPAGPKHVTWCAWHPGRSFTVSTKWKLIKLPSRGDHITWDTGVGWGRDSGSQRHTKPWILTQCVEKISLSTYRC